MDAVLRGNENTAAKAVDKVALRPRPLLVTCLDGSLRRQRRI
jgi:hypothetical protein